MPDRVRALVVGAGLMGRWHAHAIRRTGGVVVGIVDLDPARAAALAARHRNAPSFADLEPALAGLTPDIVHVCTPLASHASLITAALGAGHHVLAEKPLAPTATETGQLLALAGSAGRLLVPVHQFVFQPGVLRLVERLSELGPLVHLEAGTASAGAAGLPEGGADVVAAEILPHFLALARRVLGGSLAEQAWEVERPRRGEWRVRGGLGGQSLGFLISMAARPTFAELRVLAERGSARVDLFHGYVVFENSTVSRAAKLIRPFSLALRTLVAGSLNLARRSILREPAYPGLTELIRRVHLAAVGRGPNPIPPEETLDIASARDRLLELLSSARGA